MKALPLQQWRVRDGTIPKQGDLVPDEVTLGEVARRAGVSPATASRALNGKDGVKPEVRDRVQLIAGAVGYRPNRAARNLAGGRTSVIGLILGSGSFRRDSYAAALAHAVAEAADAHDEGLMLITESRSPNQAVRNMLSDGLVDGVIVSAVAAGEQWVGELIEANVPTVLIGSHSRRSDVCVVDVENLHSSATVVGHMLDTGRKRIAILTGPTSRADASARLSGYRLAHTERGLEADGELVFPSDFDRRSGYAATEAILNSGADAVFSSNDEMAIGLFQGLRERSIAVPEDMCLAGFDGLPTDDFSAPTLTTVSVPFTEVAHRAVTTLIEVVDGGTPGRVQTIEPEVLFRQTTRDLPST